jgi:hypothetical protein
MHKRDDHPLKQLKGTGTGDDEQTERHLALWSKMKAVYPPAQVAPYDSSSSGASPLATRWTKLATKAGSGPAVTRMLMHKRFDVQYLENQRAVQKMG